ncbi:MAG: filamentous hemagglutinin N-terminal domain-containing protein [Thainema sp.]
MITQATRCKCKHTAWAISALSISFILGIQSSVKAQSITSSPDGTGTIVSPNGQQFEIRGGQISGRNQFHSFDRFNLNTGETANFITNENIQNVLGRIIGGEPSSINGLLQLTGGNANLYLINPTGIIFGPEARLDVPSSFFATTADHLRFGENLFDVYNSIDFSELTGDPTGFIFTSDRVGAILNLGELQVPNGDLALLGGTVISTGSLSATEGRIIITAVEGGNEVNINYDGSLLTLTIQRTDILNNADENIAPVTSLPELLTGSDFSDEASELVVKEDGSVWLTSSSDGTEASEIELGRDGILYVDDIFSSGRSAFLLYRDLINDRFWTEFRRDVADEVWYADSATDRRIILSVQDISNLSLQGFKLYSAYSLELTEDASTTPSVRWASRDPSPIEGLAPLPVSDVEQNMSITSDPIESPIVDETIDSMVFNSALELKSGLGLNAQPAIVPSDFRFTFEIDPAAFIIERTPWSRDSDVLLPSPSLDNLLIFSSQENSS